MSQTRAPNLPAIPSTPRRNDDAVLKSLAAIKEVLEYMSGRRGDILDKAATFRDLRDLGVIKDARGGNYVDADNIAQVLGDLEPNPAVGEDATYVPPAITGLTATSAQNVIILDWDTPGSVNHAYTEIWRADTNNLGVAVKIGTSEGGLYADSLGGGLITKYYWVRAVSKANVIGPFNAVAGTGEESTEIAMILEDLSVTAAKLADGAVEEAKLNNGAVTATKIGALAVGVAAIANGAITSAKIGELAVDSAKIASGAIVEAKIGSAAVTEAKIGSAAVTNAKIGNAAITTAKIGTAQVDTLTIAGQAVVQPVVAFTSGAVYTYSTTWVTVQTCAIACTGSPMFVTFSALCVVSGSASVNGFLYFRMRRGVTVVWAQQIVLKSILDYSAFGTTSITIRDAPGVGTHAYYADIGLSANLGSGVAHNRSFVILEVKR